MLKTKPISLLFVMYNNHVLMTYRHYIIKVFMYPATYYHLLLIFFNRYKCDWSILFLDFLRNCTVKCFVILQSSKEKPDIFHQICFSSEDGWKDGRIYLSY